MKRELDMVTEATRWTPDSSESAGVFGGGSMGAAIAALFLGFGESVIVVEDDIECRESLAARVARLVKHGRLLGRSPREGSAGALTVTDDVGKVASVTTVVKVVNEDLEAKRAACTITNLAGLCPRAEDLIGGYFMNPAYLIDTVEVVRGPATSERAVESVTRPLAEVGRSPVFVADGIGFVTSRLPHQMINEAARIVHEGVADAASVDRIMESALGHPMGPLKTADLIGIDNLVDSIRAQAAQDGSRFAEPCRLRTEMVRSGVVGRKAGRGFYVYGEL